VKRSSVFYWFTGVAIAAIAIGAAFYFDAAVRDFVAHHQNRALLHLMHNVIGRNISRWVSFSPELPGGAAIKNGRASFCRC